ncbi:O-antigen polymerase [Planctopirus limnophila DSM 3776]|uniref:O-antigen polymerase n=1 Tax=Planctopirus limnophila (strain ATCC 43296 / DSM 3776 / IFAM 1008 / Mu 290) TaxID=521674 RepID=D5SZ20_PLAL2|nr:O-antigen ligase family protein [Planctopirus limnophila]ADG69921.1 O-antigen polymerase [Planctopirus limnophila DSM 3776]
MDATHAEHRSHRSSRRSSSRHRESHARTALNEHSSVRHWTLLDVALVLLAFAIPFIMGGREPYGWIALAILGPLAAGLWCLRQIVTDEPTPLVWSWMYLPMAFVAGVMFLQLTPLPEATLKSISPQLTTLVSLSPGTGAASTWKLLTVAPHESQQGLILFLSTALVFAMTYQHQRQTSDAWRVLGIIACAIIAMALFALLQFFAGTNLFFGFYEHHFGTAKDVVKGAFTNRNNFAHFMAIGIGPVLAWMCYWHMQHQQPADQPSTGGFSSPGFGKTSGISIALIMAGLLAVSAIVISFASLRSLSRMGSIVTILAILTFMISGSFARLISFRMLMGGLLACALVAGGLVIFKPEFMSLDEKVEVAISGGIEEMDGEDGRRKLWQALTVMIKDFPLVGSGLGSHREIYPVYLPKKDGETEYTHAENGYLQIAVELGLPALACAILALVIVFAASIRLHLAKDQELRLIGVAILSAAVATTIHSVTDFAWYAPGNTVILAMLAAVACRCDAFARLQPKGTSSEVSSAVPALPGLQLPQWFYAAPLALTILAGTWWTLELTPVVKAYTQFRQFQLLVFRPRPDIEPQEINTLKLKHILAATKLDPADGRYAILASLQLKNFFIELQERDPENAIPLAQLQQTAGSGGFESNAQLREWLQRVVGPSLKYIDASHQLARRSVRSLPLTGTAYLQMYELGFLQGSSAEQSRNMLEQGLVVRPYASNLLLAKGTALITSGEAEAGMALWKQVFVDYSSARRQIINLLAPSIPAQELIAQFEPDSKAASDILAAYTKLKKEADVVLAADALGKILTRESDQAAPEIARGKLISAAYQFWNAKNLAALRETLAKVEELHPETVAQHRDLGGLYMRLQEWDSAERHLKRCVDLQPANPAYAKMYESVLRSRQSAQRSLSPRTSLVIPAGHQTSPSLSPLR